MPFVSVKYFHHSPLSPCWEYHNKIIFWFHVIVLIVYLLSLLTQWINETVSLKTKNEKIRNLESRTIAFWKTSFQLSSWIVSNTKTWRSRTPLQNGTRSTVSSINSTQARDCRVARYRRYLNWPLSFYPRKQMAKGKIQVCGTTNWAPNLAPKNEGSAWGKHPITKSFTNKVPSSLTQPHPTWLPQIIVPKLFHGSAL